MVAKINELIHTVYVKRILNREAELNALQAQINPHFFYNTLQIMDLIPEDEGINEISNICQSLSTIFWYSINRGKEMVLLRDEIEHINSYLIIQK